MGDVVTREIGDIHALGELGPAWWDLWRRCPMATPFQTPDWLVAWWRHFAPGPLRTIAAFAGDRLVGLFPFYLEEGERGRRLLPVGISLSDYLDVLLDPAFPSAGDSLVAHMLTLPWEVWSFEELSQSAAALTLVCPAACTDWIDVQSSCPMLQLAGPEDLTGCVPSRRRRQLRRAMAFAARRGAMSIEEAGPDTDAFMDALASLHAARWRARGLPGLLAQERVEAFQREALKALLPTGLTRCYTIAIDGRVVGAFLGLVARQQAFAYLAGFDPDYAEESPGSVLIGHAIRQAIREGAREFHFLRGREAYKYTWGASDCWNRHRTWSRT